MFCALSVSLPNFKVVKNVKRSLSVYQFTQISDKTFKLLVKVYQLLNYLFVEAAKANKVSHGKLLPYSLLDIWFAVNYVLLRTFLLLYSTSAEKIVSYSFQAAHRVAVHALQVIDGELISAAIVKSMHCEAAHSDICNLFCFET